jgi:homocysteine S-methyltransferase
MKRYTLEETLQKAGGVMIIDGSMSTALEEMDCDLNDRLWTAKVLAEQPEKIRTVHYNYFKAGADCGITASYQASFPGLEAAGYTEEQAAGIIHRSVELFHEARDQWLREGHEERAVPLCLGACGPYGAYLADGSEYRGRYGVSDEALYAFHQKRAEILWEAGSDLLLFETQPSLHEALIEADIAETMKADYMVSFSCRDGGHINEGNTIEECAEVLSKDHPHLKMLSVNCTMPEYMAELITRMKKNTPLPIAVYPNSGKIYDPSDKTWKNNKDDTTSFEDYALLWMKTGAKAVGGCCTTTCTHIEQVYRAREKFYQEGKPQFILR